MGVDIIDGGVAGQRAVFMSDIIRTRHRIVARAAPGMTAHKPPCGKPKPFYGAMKPQGLDGILGACGGETTTPREHRGDADLVEPYGYDQPFRQ